MVGVTVGGAYPCMRATVSDHFIGRRRGGRGIFRLGERNRLSLSAQRSIVRHRHSHVLSILILFPACQFDDVVSDGG